MNKEGTDDVEHLPSWIGRLSYKPFALNGENKAQRVNADPLVGARYQDIRRYNACSDNKAEENIFQVPQNNRVLFAIGFKLCEVSDMADAAGG